METIRSLGMPFAADNGCFGRFNEVRFVNMLGRLRGVPGLLWVAAPDVVEDSVATLRLFRKWRPRMEGVPVAFVAQCGAERLPIPWEQMDAIFIGGTTEWKLSDEARRLCKEAKDRGKLSHVGRVNSRRRIRLLASWGCVDTVDGSGFSQWPDTKLPKGLRWIEEAVGMAAGKEGSWPTRSRNAT